MNNLWVWLLQQILPRRFWYRRFYLRSEHWLWVRAVKIDIEKRRCEKCKRIVPLNYILDIHHKIYYRNGKSILWHEEVNDLQVLCRACHNKTHNVKG